MKKLLCTALCALALLTLAACGVERPAQESAQPTPSPTAAPSLNEPGANLEISAPTLDDVDWIRFDVPAGDYTTAAARWDFSSEEKLALVEAISGIELTGPAEGPEFDEIGSYVSGPKELYGIAFTCRGDIQDAFGHTTVLYRYGVYEDDIIALPGRGYFKYNPESFDIGMLAGLIANRPIPEPSQEAIDSAIAAASSWVEEWDGVVLEEIWYDAEADALWSGTASHDNFNQQVFNDLEHITVCFTYSSPAGETMAGIKPGETGAIVLVRFGDSSWETRVLTARTQ